MKRNVILTLLCCLGGLSIYAQTGLVEYPKVSTVRPPVGYYSHVAVASGNVKTLYIAGQVGNDSSGVVPEDVVAQARNALRNVRNIVESQGGHINDIVKWNWYIVGPLSPEQLAGIREARLALTKDRTAPPPASTWVYVSALAAPQYRIEIEAIAAVPVR